MREVAPMKQQLDYEVRVERALADGTAPEESPTVAKFSADDDATAIGLYAQVLAEMPFRVAPRFWRATMLNGLRVVHQWGAGPTIYGPMRAGS